MIILQKEIIKSGLTEKSIVLIFGIGLIGSYVLKTLVSNSFTTVSELAFSWTDENIRDIQTKAIIESFSKISENLDQNITKINILWSAGKGGFGMSESDASSELKSYSDVIKLAHVLNNIFIRTPICFHLVSSAGGLFEGQRNVVNNSIPQLKRSYAYLKMAQENLLTSCDSLIANIYRPSSVFGFAGVGRRLGLIPTLLLNGVNNRCSIIYGNPDTLRDYVYANDVGYFIANQILSGSLFTQTYILASGKPTSLHEVSIRVQHYLNKKIFLRYIRSDDNVADNTFKQSTYPEFWNPIDIETGVRKIGQQLFLS